jgi:hypothetical protein
LQPTVWLEGTNLQRWIKIYNLLCYCIVSAVHETPEVGQPGPSADEYVAVVTFAAKARGVTIAVHKETQKDSSAMPQRTHAY